MKGFFKKLFCWHKWSFEGEPARPWRPWQKKVCIKCGEETYSYYG